MEWIQQGSRGDDVLEVQKKLQAMGYDPGPLDGIYGSQTAAAVRRYQESKGLQVDGIVGPATGGSLGISAATEVASTGGAVMADQEPEPTEATFDPAAGVKAEAERAAAEEVGKDGEATLSALKGSADDMEKDDAVEAVTDAMKSAAETADDSGKVGGSLWSRITGKNRKRGR